MLEARVLLGTKAIYIVNSTMPGLLGTVLPEHALSLCCA
jgi:hypothetical protein